MAEELQRFVENRPIKSRPIPTYQRFWRWCKRDPWLAGASLTAAALVVALAIVSSLAAWNYHAQLKKVEASEGHALEANKEGQKQLFQALYDRARAQRLSRREGQRFQSLVALEEAVKIGRTLNLPPKEFEPLRDEAIACMALPDLEKVGRAIPLPPGVIATARDSTGDRCAFAFSDGTIRIRRLADGHEVARLHGPADREVRHFLFSPDGRYLAITHFEGGSLTVWDIDRRAVALEDPGPIACDHSARFSPDSSQFALAHGNGELIVRDLSTGRILWRRDNLGQPRDLSFRPDGTLIAVLYQGNAPSCRLIDAKTGSPVREIPMPATGDWVTWSPDSMTLATACDDRRIYVWDVFGIRRGSLEGHRNDGVRVAFHPSGTLLASTDWDGRVRLWDPILARPWMSVTGGMDPLVFAHDGVLDVCSEDQMITYRVEPSQAYRSLAPFSELPQDYLKVEIRQDGRVAALGTNRGVALFNPADGSRIAFLPIGATRCLFGTSGDLLTSGPVGVWRWPVQLNPHLKRFRIGPPLQLRLPPGGNIDLASDRTGRIIARANFENCVVLTPERSFLMSPLVNCRYVAISPDGRWLATGSHGLNGVQVWSLPDARQMAHPLTAERGECPIQPRREMAHDLGRTVSTLGGRQLASGAANRWLWPLLFPGRPDGGRPGC